MNCPLASFRVFFELLGSFVGQRFDSSLDDFRNLGGAGQDGFTSRGMASGGSICADNRRRLFVKVEIARFRKR